MPRTVRSPSAAGGAAAGALTMPVLFQDGAAMQSLRTSVASWFATHQRPLPWRPQPGDGHRDAYGTWVCEIMSQQTRIQTVVEYWQRWMKAFPTVAALAAADSGQVRALWAGLGYYRRAELLHKGAQYVVANHDGKLPHTAAELQNIPGIGPYTAGAIASICFNAMTPAVDGNVVRVLSRLGGAEDVDPKDPKHVRYVWDWGHQVMRGGHQDGEEKKDHAGRGVRQRAAQRQPPTVQAGHITEGLIELGATVCRPSGPPDCGACPLSSMCSARAMLAAGDIEAIDGVIPRRGSKVSVSEQHVVAVAHAAVGDEHNGKETKKVPLATRGSEGTVHMILAQRPATGLLASMYEVPNLPLASVACDAATLDGDGTCNRIADCGLTVDSLAPLRFLCDGGIVRGGDGSPATKGGRAMPVKRERKTTDGAAVVTGAPTPQYLGRFVHKFSHIRMTVDVYAMMYASVEALHDVVARRGGGLVFGPPRDVRVVSEHHRAEQQVAVAKIAETIFSMVRKHHRQRHQLKEDAVSPVAPSAPRKRPRKSRSSEDD